MNVINGIKKLFSLNEKNALLVLVLLCLGVPVVARVSAMIFSPPSPEPKFYGTLTLNIYVQNVVDLYAWQAKVTFNPNDLCVRDVKPGDVLNASYVNESSNIDVGDAIFLNASINDGILLVGATRVGNVPGVSGNGTLATITFEVKYSDFDDNPHIAFDEDTFLLDSYSEQIGNVEKLLAIKQS